MVAADVPSLSSGHHRRRRGSGVVLAGGGGDRDRREGNRPVLALRFCGFLAVLRPRGVVRPLPPPPLSPVVWRASGLLES